MKKDERGKNRKWEEREKHAVPSFFSTGKRRHKRWRISKGGRDEVSAIIFISLFPGRGGGGNWNYGGEGRILLLRAAKRDKKNPSLLYWYALEKRGEK